MKQGLTILWLLCLTSFSYGQQTIQYAESNGLTIKLPADWIVLQENDQDQFDNLYYLIVAKKTNGQHTWTKIVIRVDISPDQFFNDGTKYHPGFKNDTISFSNYKAIRFFHQDESRYLFGEDDVVDKPFHIEWFVKINDKKYLNISGDYSSLNDKEVEELKTELLTFVKSITIK